MATSTESPTLSANNDFLKRAFRGGNSQKIAEEARLVTTRASKEAEGIITRLHSAAQERAREIILARRSRRQAWEDLPWWKKPFFSRE